MANFFSLVTNFLKETKTELRGVTWLSRQDTVRYTMIVIGISAAVAVFLGALDYIFQILVGRLAM